MSSREHVPDALREACRETTIFDTHEHMLPRKRLAEGPVGLSDLLRHSYVAWAMRTTPAGGWEALRTALDPVRTRAFYRSWIGAMRDLYGFAGDLDGRNWDAVSAQVAANYERADWPPHEVVERALANLVRRDRLALDEACVMARRILYGNAVELYGFGAARAAADRGGDSTARS